MSKKIKSFFIPCILTMLWICVLLEICKLLTPLNLLVTVFNRDAFYSAYFNGSIGSHFYNHGWFEYFLAQSFFLPSDYNVRLVYSMLTVFTLILYIALALSVPFVFSKICKKFNVGDESDTKYLLISVFTVVFCRLSWTKVYSHWSLDISLSISTIYGVLTAFAFFIVLTAISALIFYIFKLVFKNKQPSRKANICKYIIIGVTLFIIAYIAVPYIGYSYVYVYGNNNYIRYLGCMFEPLIISGNKIPIYFVYCLTSITTVPSVILVLVVLFNYYALTKKAKEGLVKNTIISIIASVVVATVLLCGYCLLNNICTCFSDSENSILAYMHEWIPGTVLLLLSPFVPLTFLAIFDVSNKNGDHKVFKYVAYAIVTIVFYVVVLPVGAENIFSLIDVVVLTWLFIITPFILLAVCIVSEKRGKPFTVKIYTLFENVLRLLEKEEQISTVKPDKFKSIKQNAIKQLGGKIFASAWLMLLLVLIIHGFITGAVAFTLIGALLVGGPMQYGLTKLQMKLIKEEDYKIDLSDLFKGFSENFTQSVLLGFLQSLFIALWSMLFVIPGMIKSYSYSMAFYIQTQSDDKSWMHALNESKRLMHGNKLKLLLLDLSFIGWYIVGSMCLGIGIIFVLPYHNQARANFYASIMQNNLETASVTESVEVTESIETVEIADDSVTA